MKVIFLDIDGVLNSHESYVRHCKETFHDNPDPEHIKHLNRIVEKTGAKVVISSTWRLGIHSLGIWRLLDAFGFKGEVIGQTPRRAGSIRGVEIGDWIDKHNKGEDLFMQVDKEVDPVESFVILDDDSDMGELLPFLVQPKIDNGLTSEDADRAIEILNIA